MTRTYDLNTASAKSAESSRITDTGSYIGVIVTAEAVTSQKGTEGVEFSFKSDSGATADFLTLWTHNTAGEELRGYDMLNALMTCAQVRQLKPAPGQIEKWDSGVGQRVKKDATVFPDLQNKRIGLLLQKAEYQKNNGQVGTKMEIFLPFCPATNRTASEVLAKREKGESVPKIASSLKDRPLKGAAAPAPATAGAGRQPLGGQPFEDDDIPFAPHSWKEC